MAPLNAAEPESLRSVVALLRHCYLQGGVRQSMNIKRWIIRSEHDLETEYCLAGTVFLPSTYPHANFTILVVWGMSRKLALFLHWAIGQCLVWGTLAKH